MASKEQIETALAAIRAELPKAVEPSRVTVCELAAGRGTLRVKLDSYLIGEWGFGGLGWFQFESGTYGSNDGSRVWRAARRALKGIKP